jgi:hypothetical protein
MLGATMPNGAKNKIDFEEAIGLVPTAGTVFYDGTSPW